MDIFNKAAAKYNMNFNNGNFKREEVYPFYEENGKVYVTTEEGNKQDFYDIDFNGLFTVLKN